jgi:hypothetical protein
MWLFKSLRQRFFTGWFAACQLPYEQFEDQRSGETLSVISLR